MLYATLLAPMLAIPGILLMDRLERWVTAGTRAQARRREPWLGASRRPDTRPAPLRD